MLIILSIGILVTCTITIAIFVYIRIKKGKELKLTETEERYFNLVELRRLIRRADKKAKSDKDNSKEHLEEKAKLKDELDRLKQKQLLEFIDVLEVVENY